MGQPGRSDRRRPAAGPVAVRRGRPHRQRLWQPPFVSADGLRQRAGRPRRRVPGAVEHLLAASATRAASTPAGQAGPRSPRTSTTTPEPRIQLWGAGLKSRINAHAAGDAHRLPRVHAGGRAAGRQPRDRPVVRLPELRRDRQVHGRAQGQELRDLPRLPGSQPHGRPGARLPDRLGQAAGAVLQGRDRVGAAHAGHGGASSCSTCTTSPARARRWWACSIRSGTRRATSRAEEFRRFCNSTVPLARLDKRYWRTGETLAAEIDDRALWAAAAARRADRLAAGLRRWARGGSGTFAAGEVAIGSGDSLRDAFGSRWTMCGRRRRCGWSWR